MKASFQNPAIIQHLERKQYPTQRPIASPLSNSISAGMFKSVCSTKPPLFPIRLTLLSTYLDTFPENRIINLLPCCLSATEGGGGGAYPALAPRSPLALCWCGCPWVGRNRWSVMAAVQSATHFQKCWPTASQHTLSETLSLDLLLIPINSETSLSHAVSGDNAMPVFFFSTIKISMIFRNECRKLISR